MKSCSITYWPWKPIFTTWFNRSTSQWENMCGRLAWPWWGSKQAAPRLCTMPNHCIDQNGDFPTSHVYIWSIDIIIYYICCWAPEALNHNVEFDTLAWVPYPMHAIPLSLIDQPYKVEWEQPQKWWYIHQCLQYAVWWYLIPPLSFGLSSTQRFPPFSNAWVPSVFLPGMPRLSKNAARGRVRKNLKNRGAGTLWSRGSRMDIIFCWPERSIGILYEWSRYVWKIKVCMKIRMVINRIIYSMMIEQYGTYIQTEKTSRCCN